PRCGHARLPPNDKAKAQQEFCASRYDGQGRNHHLGQKPIEGCGIRNEPCETPPRDIGLADGPPQSEAICHSGKKRGTQSDPQENRTELERARHYPPGGVPGVKLPHAGRPFTGEHTIWSEVYWVHPLFSISWLVRIIETHFVPSRAR